MSIDLLCDPSTCSSLVIHLVVYVDTLVIRQFGYLLKSKENVEELIGRRGDVEAKKKDIQDQIDAASRDGKQPTHEVTRWIQKVEGLIGEVTTVETDYNQRGRCWPNCCSSYKIGRRASKLLIKLEARDTEHARLGVITKDAPPAPVQQMPSTSNVVGNMITSNKEKICGYLQEEPDGAVIGIWGMGGVGKTTLLEAVNNNFLNNNANSVTNNSGTNKLFDHVIFVVVSKEHQLENIQKKIVEKLGLTSREGLDSQAGIISDYLKQKNFLLLLDDIWKVVQLKDLGIPEPHSSSSSGDGRRFIRKVVFTTRSWQVCKHMNCQGRNIKVECLKTDEAWNLFKEKVGEDIIDLPGIKSRAEEVIKECGGLPLALVVIGRAMATKKSPEEWDYALTHLKKSQPIPGTETEEYYFPRLKFSYDSLGDDQMRDCFLCCSLWPEDFEIKKEEIIMCWMGLGLIDDIEDINEAYNKGYFLIGSLTEASLLEDKDNRIKLHDVIRDLALWIARDSGTNKNKWLVKAGVGLEEVPNELVAKREVAEVAERVSLMENSIEELPPCLPPCPNLSALLLQENRQLSWIPENFFTCMPILTYLDLSGTRLEEIPKEICCLVQLRYLNLSHTKIKSLPEELGQLINLKYMLLQHTKLGEVRGIIGRLLKLEYLDLYPSGHVDTDELLRLPLLKALGMKIRSEHALRQLSRVPILRLNIEDMGDSTTTSIHLHHLLSSCTQVGLRKLSFTDCHRISELVVDVDVRLPRLESLELSGLPKLTEIAWRRRSVLPPSECFQRLRYIEISNCNGLKDITWVLHLPCLEYLRLYGCDEIERLVVIGRGGEEEEEITKATTFPSLRWLRLTGLPKLAMICDNHAAAAAAVNFPSLEWLRVSKCNELKKLPFHPQQQLLNNNNCSRLKFIRGEREWWEGIEWESAYQSSLLQPYFKARDLL